MSFSQSELSQGLEENAIWRALTALPKRVAELEQRLASLEQSIDNRAEKPPVPQARMCPLCNGTMDVVKEAPHEHFAFAGLKTHSMKCSACGNSTERDFDPAKGYK